MCRTYFVRWVDDEGKAIEDAPEGFVFPHEEGDEYLPTCTCWIADNEPDGNVVWQRFTEKLRPLFDAPYSGCRIEIEVM